jgi:hypothetical protein
LVKLTIQSPSIVKDWSKQLYSQLCRVPVGHQLVNQTGPARLSQKEKQKR